MFLKLFHHAAQNVYKATASVMCPTSLKGLLFSEERKLLWVFTMLIIYIDRQTDRQTDRQIDR